MSLTGMLKCTTDVMSGIGSSPRFSRCCIGFIGSSRHRLGPWIEYRCSGSTVLRCITRDDRQATIQCSRRDDQIRLRECYPLLAPGFDDKPPFQEHVFRDREHASFEHWPYIMR